MSATLAADIEKPAPTEGVDSEPKLSQRLQLVGALVRLEAWARICGLEEEASLLEPAIERLDARLTAA